jgi:Peptidase family M1 domain
MKGFFFAFLFIFLYQFSKAQNTEIANYTIDAELLPAAKLIKGKQTLYWTNTSSKAVSTLQFHAYLNAFKDKNSTFFKEQQYNKLFNYIKVPPQNELGGIQITKIKTASGQILSYAYIQTDDENKTDKTVLEVKLKNPLATGNSIALEIIFESSLPKMIARTGYDTNEFFFVGQWFPKIGVLDKYGNWNCHQFHEHTEFFADFGKYDVKLTLPKRFIVAGTGVLKNSMAVKLNRVLHHFKAERVHDFAWVASPDFKVNKEYFKGIEINTFLMPEHSSLQSRYSESLKNAIDYMQAHVGKYPHPTINLIDPPIYASESGGMEYPMLIGCGSYLGLGKNIRMQEVVTIHEFIHQYFQGIMASNEFENSWLDEGFTQYYEGKVMQQYYQGSQFSFYGFELNDLQSSRDGYISMRFPEICALRTDAWKYPRGSYGILSYQKPATILKTLENYLGESKMNFLMKSYFEKYRFSHPAPEDFVVLVQSFIPANEKVLRKFVSDAVYSPKSCDYGIENIKGKTLLLFKKGDLKLPVEMKINFEDGSSQTILVGEKLNYTFRKNIISAIIDPGLKNWMDLNWLNNSKTVINGNQPFAVKYGSKFMFWIQQLLT